MHILTVPKNDSFAITNNMSEVNIEIKSVAAREDIQRWEDHMLVKAKCWNQFCDGLCSDNEIRAVHVVKEDSYGVLVREEYLMVEPRN